MTQIRIKHGVRMQNLPNCIGATTKDIGKRPLEVDDAAKPTASTSTLNGEKKAKTIGVFKVPPRKAANTANLVDKITPTASTSTSNLGKEEMEEEEEKKKMKKKKRNLEEMVQRLKEIDEEISSSNLLQPLTYNTRFHYRRGNQPYINPYRRNTRRDPYRYRREVKETADDKKNKFSWMRYAK